MMDVIATIARRAAHADLNLKNARWLFDALYVADAIMLEGGNLTKAATRAGVRTECLTRMRARHTPAQAQKGE